MQNNNILQDKLLVQGYLINQQYSAQNQLNNIQYAQSNYNQIQSQYGQQNNMSSWNEVTNLSKSLEMIEPDFLYCKQSMINQSCNDKTKQVQNLSILLQQVLSQLQLRFISIQLISKVNMYSGLYCEEKIIRPLINDNIHLDELVIRNGYVVNCCNILCSKMKSQALAAVVILFFTLLYQFLFDFIYYINTYSYINRISNVNFVFISQFSITSIIFILFLFSTLTFNIKILYACYILSIVNQLMVATEVSCSFIVGQEDSNAVFAYLYISFGLLALLLISCIIIKHIQINQVKLLVLVSNMEQNEFSKL
ncbi:hypothetical protein ABPG74_018098 [Tetrahymena malaccensis]